MWNVCFFLQKWKYLIEEKYLFFYTVSQFGAYLNLTTCTCLLSTYILNILLLFFIVALSGYVEDVGEIIKSSQSANTYFNIKLRTGKNETQRVRIMTHGVKRQMFADKKYAVQPIKLFNITQVSNGINFYNTNKGSRMTDEQLMDFPFNPDCQSLYTSVEELKSKSRGLYNVRGLFHWLSPANEVTVRSPSKVSTPTKKNVRDGVIVDASGSIPIAIWGNLISTMEENISLSFTDVTLKFFRCKKLETTHTTNISVCDDAPEIPTPDWQSLESNYKKDMKGSLSTIANPQVRNVVANIFYKCNSNTCSKKLTITPGSTTVRCQYCSRVMLVSTCEKSVHADIEFKLDETTYHLTIFDNVLIKTFPDLVLDDVEEHILLLNHFEVTFNAKKVITEIKLSK